MSTPDTELLEVFREEAAERIDSMVETLLALESGQAAPDAIDSLFRDAHSIKGSAGMVGIDEVRTIAHSIEDTLEEPRRTGTFSPELADPLLRATDALRRAVGVDVKPAATRAPVRRSMQMDAGKFDEFFDAVGETALHTRRLEGLLEADAADAESITEELDQGNALLAELQHSVIQLRTLPLSSITGPFPRAVRDLAAAKGKEVELEISGTETQLDRVILEGISESITHLLTNAVAHGIEVPEERERAGKPSRGVIALRAERRGSRVAIEVADDGRGVPADLLAGPGGGSLVDTLAEAGFSTAEEVDEVSGRGVGLDAVKSHVESLGGELQVESQPGRGTAVTMLLPLTLSLQQMLLVERAGAIFGVPLPSVDEAIAVTGTMALAGRESIEVRGRAVPLADLAEVIGAPARELPAQPQAMVVSASGRRVAVLCDRIVAEQELVIKGLGPLLAGVPGYLGATILHDGRIALVLDPAQITRLGGRARGTSLEPRAEPEQPTVLVVDDQFTVRELQRSILEAAGYRVRTARDGREALAEVADDGAVGLVVTDLQMPEMDGIELLRAIRDSREYASLPVVVVTSQGGEDDRRRGLEAGADAYILKDQFDQQTLLATVDRLLAR
jgi:two-component system, chemotaxis family, sensor kinase CheA